MGAGRWAYWIDGIRDAGHRAPVSSTTRGRQVAYLPGHHRATYGTLRTAALAGVMAIELRLGWGSSAYARRFRILFIHPSVMWIGG